MFSFQTVLSKEDPALQLLTLKSHLKEDINRIMNYYEKHKKGLHIKNLNNNVYIYINLINILFC